MKHFFLLIILGFKYFNLFSINPSDFIRAKNSQLIIGVNERPITLRGVNFVNDAGWLNYSNLFISQDHSEIDYNRIKEMGMNVVRFMVDYDFFVDDSAPYIYRSEGWALLDTNLKWASKNGVFLILDMQLAFNSSFGPNNPVWKDNEKRKRLKSLWKTIAERYNNDTTFAAYDLINEPIPPDSHSQWTQLAQELIDTIRSVDINHLLIVEQSIRPQSEQLNLVNDTNVMYDFHFYFPHNYSHQFEVYANRGDGGYYPDSTVCITRDFMGADPPWYSEIYTRSLPQGNSDWAFYSSEMFKSNDSLIVDAVPFFKCKNNSGCAYFDDFILEEFDAQQNLIRKNHFEIDTIQSLWTLPEIDTMKSFFNNWFLYPDTGNNGNYNLVNTGHIGNYSFSICNTTSFLSLANDQISYKIKPTNYYRISGWMKGSGINGDSCSMGLGFQRLNNYSEFVPFTKQYLQKVFLDKITFGQNNNVPINIGEYGLMKYCFESNISTLTLNRGGLIWVEDLMDLFEANNVNYQYFAYHSWSFGLFTNSIGLPDTLFSNKDIINFFKSKFILTPTNNYSDNPEILNGKINHFLQNTENGFLITVTIDKPSKIFIEIYNSTNQIIGIIPKVNFNSGIFQIPWSQRNLPSGLYFFRIVSSAMESVVLKGVHQKQ
ncbi:MAG: hypothetical protein A3H98_02135 [Bacteroidetes bacterium RIFCSPLOWO2_02_FULL_36_8]|nr:MAG: hypothetical protein A3H98_02135 [Bacteroidetes bacterium RIFCSPLOWO2_02_FULL_36_8]OFY69209.1 MAG: hypothetical protein A3G23_06580 [Bacteroidetes bacterium RIFCSPLOWO2_12_FULL_37_12]